MITRARKVPTKTWRNKYSLLMASLAFHALVMMVTLPFLGVYSPGGKGTGDGANGDNWSATLLPSGSGEYGGRRRGDTDTVIPDEESDGSNEIRQTIEMQPANEKPRLLTLVETDPQTVFAVINETSISIEAEQQAALRVAELNKPVYLKSTHLSVPHQQASVMSGLDQSAILDASASDQTGNDISSNKGNTVGQGAGGEPGKGGGHQTSFFGIKAPSKRIVYVIDASESMRQHDAMQFARQKLWDSLQELTSTSQFQLIFFNVTTHTLNRPGERIRLLPATSVNLRLAKQFLTGIQPDAGTNRMGALSLALSYDPDVIYLLTDADAPELSAKDLWDLKRANKRKAFMHVVEFGVGADLGPDNFLKKLARQNAGIHRYQDLTQSQR
jgi:von Willebrand factor type A domain